MANIWLIFFDIRVSVAPLFILVVGSHYFLLRE